MSFKAGDKVKCIEAEESGGMLTTNEHYIIDSVTPGGNVSLIGGDSIIWYAGRFKLVEKEKVMEKQLNPATGDKIICNNGEEFTCCTRGFLQSKKIYSDWNYKLYAYRDNPKNEFTGISWMGWSLDGKATGCKEWDIREVIPKQKDKSGTNSFDKNDATQESYMELRHNQDGTISALNVYTAEDIRSAFIDDLSWTESYLEMFMKSLEKVTKPEYKEYLRLKDMFENEQ